MILLLLALLSLRTLLGEALTGALAEEGWTTISDTRRRGGSAGDLGLGVSVPGGDKLNSAEPSRRSLTEAVGVEVCELIGDRCVGSRKRCSGEAAVA